MPIADRTDPEEPQADAELLDFIDRRRDQQARQRRHRILVAAIAALALIAVALAFSNVILLRRLAERGESPGPARVSPSSPPVATAPAAPAAPVAPAPAAPPPAAPAPPPEIAAPSPPAATAGAVLESTSTPPVTAPPEIKSKVAAEGDSARRTARWLVQTHGRLEAENRAAKVAEFYSGEQGAFWRRVLLNVRQEPER